MGHQIIKQPDGLLAVWSTGTDSWILYDGTPEEIVEYYAERAAEDARRSARATVDAVLAGEPERRYYQFTMTFEEANREHLERGHEPIPFAHLATTREGQSET